MKRFVFLLALLLISCTPLVERFAPEDPLGYLGNEIAFNRVTDWQEEINIYVQDIIKDASTKEEKIQAIAYFITNSKEYSSNEVQDQVGQTVEKIFQKQKGVCYDSAVLLTAMARAIDIPARVVFPLLSSHSFVQVFIDGRWINVDATFGDVSYNFVLNQPLYIYMTVKDGVFERRFLKDSRFLSLIIPTPKNQMVQIQKKTNGNYILCENLNCQEVPTTEEYQTIMFGFEKYNSIDGEIISHDLGLSVSLPAGEYKVSHIKDNQCKGSSIVNLNENRIIKKLGKC